MVDRFRRHFRPLDGEWTAGLLLRAFRRNRSGSACGDGALARVLPRWIRVPLAASALLVRSLFDDDRRVSPPGRAILPDCSADTAAAIQAGFRRDNAMPNRPELVRFLATRGRYFFITSAAPLPGNVAAVFEIETDGGWQRLLAGQRQQPALRCVSAVAEPLPPLRIARGRESAWHPTTEWNPCDHGYADVHCARGRTYDHKGNLITARRCPAWGRFDGNGSGDRPVEQKTKTAPKIVNPFSCRREDLQMARKLVARARQIERKRFARTSNE
jgi:hypothetical protein